MVELMTNDMMDKMVGFIKNELIEDGGDMFQVPMKIFDVMTSDEINYKDIVVMTDRTNLNFDLVSEYMQYRFHEYDFTAKLAPYVDYSRMSLKSDEDLKYVVFMMEDAIRSAMVNVAKNAKAHKKEREILRKKIELLQRAVEYK